MNLTSVDLRRLVRELADFFAPQADAAGVLMRTALPEEAIRCQLDEGLIKQALLNLMINATEVMGAGGELFIKVTANRDHAVLEVIDTGPGISRDQLDKIFQVYYSTKSTGTGLGLPTTRRIVREHGGQISVESEPGKGTRFVLTFPLTP